MQISKLDHQNQQQANQIWQLFQSAYEIEAQVLGLQEFPPLNRTSQQIEQSATTFFGGWHDNALVAVIELEEVDAQWIHINSFGVSPAYFRQGFGTQLLNGVLNLYVWQRFTVATAVANIPAIQFYQKSGFQQQEQWITPDHMRMVTLLKS